jgi:hypothetical protein
MAGEKVSIWTLNGREKIPFVCGTPQQALLRYRKGEVDLMRVAGKWHLAVGVTCPIPRRSAPKMCSASISASSTLPRIARDAPTPGPRWSKGMCDQMRTPEGTQVAGTSGDDVPIRSA